MMIQGKVWGETSPIFNRHNVEVHYIKIKKGGFCSKHLHKHKFNKFVVLTGTLKITVWKEYGLEDVTILKNDQSCAVPPNEFHKFEALEDTVALEIYWVDLDEKDIVRDGYGGVNEYAEKTDTGYPVKGYQADRPAVFTDELKRAQESTQQLQDGTERSYKKYYGND